MRRSVLLDRSRSSTATTRAISLKSDPVLVKLARFSDVVGDFEEISADVGGESLGGIEISVFFGDISSVD
jgi:hypothetical protein